MLNEYLFIISALTDILFVFISARLGKEWIFGTIIANLILIGIFGAKLVSAFGVVTNIGNVFYACVFLATYFLLEKHGRRAGITAIWFGFSSMIFFALLSQFAVQSIGFRESDSVNTALTTLFSFSPRIILASIIGYVFAQYLNIRIFEWLKNKTQGKHLWLRSNVSNIVSQFIDSALFFSIAFFDMVGPLLLQVILLGWIAKSVVVLIGTPLLCIDKYLNNRK